MATFWHSYKFRIIGATLGVLLHLLLIGLKFMATDFPITLLWTIFIGVVGAGGTLLVWTYFIGGTLMYAVLGWFMGPFLERQALLYRFGSSGSNDR